MIARMGFLPLENLADFSPGLVQAAGAMGQFVLDELVQSREVVARHAGVHVMLRVVVHVPVEELKYGVQVQRAAAKAEIRHVVPQPACWELLHR